MTRVDRRIPKKLLIEQGAVTAADKRQIQDGIEEILWIAALKPNNIGVAAFKDEVRGYLEIAIISMALRASAKPTRLTELIHRTIPYPMVLWTDQDGAASLSLAHKRWSQGESGEVVVEEVQRSPWIHPGTPTVAEAAFLASLPISELPNRNLYVLYQGWLDRVVALEAATITGVFALKGSDGSTESRRASLAAHAALQRELAALRVRAKGEKQINRLVELNLALKRLEAELAAAVGDLR